MSLFSIRARQCFVLLLLLPVVACGPSRRDRDRDRDRDDVRSDAGHTAPDGGTDDETDGGPEPDPELCGNGFLDPDESCDPAITVGKGVCPTSCDGAQACSASQLVGSASLCTARCTTVPITQCISGDGCCPNGCSRPGDSDCAGASPVGGPCGSDAQCGSGLCIDETSSGWKGGYCTAACANDSDCDSGTHCYGAAGGRGRCMKSCTSNSQCRSGYGCADSDGDGAKECIPLADGPGAVGARCERFTDCSGGVFGFCATESQGFRGGYCTQDCGSHNPCPQGSHCGTPDDDGIGICLQNCTWSSSFREGYRCFDIDDDGVTEWYPAATGSGQTGSACTGTWQCAGDEYGACLTESRYGFPAGYCTQVCSSDSHCPTTGSHCATGLGLCMKSCVSNSDCRGAGYVCAQLDGTGKSECVAGGTGTGAVGAACGTVADCSGGVSGLCFASENWPAGYCSRRCPSGTGCPSGSACVQAGPETSDLYCLDTCTSSSQCRDGYECRSYGGSSICVPR